MKSSIRDKAEGAFHKEKGNVKEVVGKVSNNPGVEAEGKREKSSGKAQQVIGKVKNILGK